MVYVCAIISVQHSDTPQAMQQNISMNTNLWMKYTQPKKVYRLTGVEDERIRSSNSAADGPVEQCESWKCQTKQSIHVNVHQSGI